MNTNYTNKKHYSCIILSFFIIFLSAGLSLGNEPKAVFNDYLRALKNGDYVEAEGCWRAEDIRASKRLGIHYTGIQVKYDCASPVINALERIRLGKVDIEVKDAIQEGGRAELTVLLTSISDSAEAVYHLVKADNGWKLASPLYYYTGLWKRTQCNYANIIYQDSSLVNEYAVEELDRFIESMGERLGISRKRMELLAREKIDYILCGEAEMEEITGYPAQGMANLQFDAVVSRHLPHYHELVHLMVNFALEELPLYTLPCLQEGTAVNFGGRWGKSPEVIFQIGHFALENGFFQLEDILTYQGFHKKVGNPDFSYPLSGILVRFLVKEIGIERFKRLYLKMSGTAVEAQGFPLEEVKSAVMEASGLSWAEIEANFTEYWKRFRYSGIIPGKTESSGQFVVELHSGKMHARIFDSDDYYYVEIMAEMDDPAGGILLNDEFCPANDNYRSRIFREQFGNLEYEGERFGIVFSGEEAGVYDYYTNTLIAKYMSSFSPCDDYRVLMRAPGTLICFSMMKGLFDRAMGEYGVKLVEI
ncbi:MAG: hypothetical protein HQ591_05090 [candidate division Zixibacteria bacterium]|nr:hypothetical protein [Candidatus Tariuqbacter arcticus]